LYQAEQQQNRILYRILILVKIYHNVEEIK